MRPAPLRALRELLEIGYNRVELRQLHGAVRDFSPDLVYARHVLFGSAPGRLARRLQIPCLIEVNAPLAAERAQHGGLVLRGLARWLETRTLNAADGVIVVTRVLGNLLERQGVRPELLEVHPNGVDPGRLAFTGDGKCRVALGLEGRTVLGFVGYVRDWNRLDRTFPFLARFPESVLLLIGDGPDRPRLEAEAERLGVAAQVRFLGSIASDEVMGHVDAFDVALLPEVTEYASPLKLLDYLAAGCAVLAPDRPNLREVLTSEKDSLLFAPQEEGSFARQLERLLADRELRERLGLAARRSLEEQGLTWDRNAERVVELARRCDARRPQATSRT